MTTRHEERLATPNAAHFSFVVDDVDARTTGVDLEDETLLHKLLTDTSIRTSPQNNQEQCDARIKQIKIEAESRKNNFARLLEEHAQVIRKLKEMEQDGAARETTSHMH